jgi:hypothetical protein
MWLSFFSSWLSICLSIAYLLTHINADNFLVLYTMAFGTAVPMKLNTLYQDMKIPLHLRDRLPVVTLDDKVIVTLYCTLLNKHFTKNIFFIVLRLLLYHHLWTTHTSKIRN